jgi:segregation and condensation protein A
MAPDTSDPTPPRDSLLLRLDGFEGPLDLLLDLARAQKVDLAKISILSLVEQFLAVIEGARRVRLELAADWLVMAAWLTWLKSRLLLPADQQEMEDGAIAAETLANRLRMLAEVRLLAVWLSTRPTLGQDVFARGMPEDHTEIDRSRLTLDLASLIASYLRSAKRGARDRYYSPRALTLWTVQDALRRLGAMLGSVPDWATLEQFLPENLTDPEERRAALASTFMAGLELTRDGVLSMRQSEAFGPIELRGRRESEDE